MGWLVVDVVLSGSLQSLELPLEPGGAQDGVGIVVDVDRRRRPRRATRSGPGAGKESAAVAAFDGAVGVHGFILPGRRVWVQGGSPRFPRFLPWKL